MSGLKTTLGSQLNRHLCDQSLCVDLDRRSFRPRGNKNVCCPRWDQGFGHDKFNARNHVQGSYRSVPYDLLGAVYSCSNHFLHVAVVTDRDQLLAVPRRMLDPRRPDVPSARDKEEFLVPYQPVLFLDPKWTISHTYDVSLPSVSTEGAFSS